MTEPTTEAGKRLLARLSLDVPWFIAGSKEVEEDMVAAIEAEAREGYVPASLSPEWHAELLAAGFGDVTALAACDLADAAAAVVAAWVDDESGMATFDPECIDALRAALARWEATR